MAADSLYVIWRQHHETGIAIVDEQYRAMLGMINSLFCSISIGKGMATLQPTLRALEEMSHIHLSTVRSFSDETHFEEFRANALFQYELFQEAKDIAREVRCEHDVLSVVRILKHWWRSFQLKQTAA